MKCSAWTGRTEHVWRSAIISVLVAVLPAVASAQAERRCPAPPLNSPDAGSPADTNFAAQSSEAQKASATLHCPLDALAPAKAGGFSPGPQAAQSPLDRRLLNALQNSQIKERTVAEAIYIKMLLGQRPSLATRFPGAWATDWCERHGWSKNKPLVHPVPPELEDELHRLDENSIGIALTLAIKGGPLPLTCETALDTWIKELRE